MGCVVSGPSRLGLDRWDEAARLAVLPKAVAAEEFAPILRGCPWNDRSHQIIWPSASNWLSFCQNTNTGFRKVASRPVHKTRNIFKQ